MKIKEDTKGYLPKNQANHDNQVNQGSDNVPRLRFPEFEGEW